MAAVFKRVACLLLAALALAGCTTTAKSNARARSAYLAGREAGMNSAAKSANPQVWFVGNLKIPIVPWTDGLTLTQALIAADYQGAEYPVRITVFRTDQPAPIIIDPQALLRGQDLPLKPGDRIDVR